MNKDLFVTLATGYVKTIKRNLDIDNTLKQFEVYIEDEGNPLNYAVETVFDSIHRMIVYELIEFSFNDFTDLELIHFCENLYDDFN